MLASSWLPFLGHDEFDGGGVRDRRLDHVRLEGFEAEHQLFDSLESFGGLSEAKTP